MIQIGNYDLGVNGPDAFVTAPEVVVYRDGNAFADLTVVSGGSVQHQLLHALLERSTIQHILDTAAEIPTELPPETNIPIDSAPLYVRAGARSWNRYQPSELHELVETVNAAVKANEDGQWRPEAWIQRPYGDDLCAVSTDDPHLASYSAPLYPHLIGRVAPGSQACPANLNGR